MRSFLFAAGALVVSCGEGTRAVPEGMPAVAAEFVAVYNGWDEGRFSALFAVERATRAETMREHFAWLHARLGPCGAPRLLWTTSSRGARWTHACERGVLETWFMLDEAGKILDMSSGAGGEPPPEVSAAAASVIASLPWDADAVRSFETNLREHDARRLGKCEVVRPWVHGPRVGLFHVNCEEGEAVFGVRLDEEGSILRAHMVEGEVYQASPDGDRG